MEEIPVAGCLVDFLPFWEEVIQADHWVLEIIHQSLIQSPQFQGIRSTPSPLKGSQVLSDEVEDLVRKGVIVLTP